MENDQSTFKIWAQAVCEVLNSQNMETSEEEIPWTTVTKDNDSWIPMGYEVNKFEE